MDVPIKDRCIKHNKLKALKTQGAICSRSKANTQLVCDFKLLNVENFISIPAFTSATLITEDVPKSDINDINMAIQWAYDYFNKVR